MASGFEEIMRELKHKVEEQAQVKAYGEEILEKGKDYAEKTSPVETGHFRDSWSVVDVPPDDGMPAFQLQNDDEGAVAIEYGTHDTPPHHTLVSTRTYMAGLAEKEVHE